MTGLQPCAYELNIEKIDPVFEPGAKAGGQMRIPGNPALRRLARIETNKITHAHPKVFNTAATHRQPSDYFRRGASDVPSLSLHITYGEVHGCKVRAREISLHLLLKIRNLPNQAVSDLIVELVFGISECAFLSPLRKRKTSSESSLNIPHQREKQTR